jgi:hypothetical protein
MYSALILHVLCEFEIGVFRNWVPRGIDGRRREDETVGWRKLHNEERNEFYVHVTVHRGKFPYNKTN